MTADGWRITDDPLTLTYGDGNLFVDLGAERGAIAAEKGEQKIAVEVQSFLSQSPVHDLELAVGQFEVYRVVLREMEPDRVLHLAVPSRVYKTLLVAPLGQLIISNVKLRLLVFDENKGVVLQWIS